MVVDMDNGGEVTTVGKVFLLHYFSPNACSRMSIWTKKRYEQPEHLNFLVFNNQKKTFFLKKSTNIFNPSQHTLATKIINVIIMEDMIEFLTWVLNCIFSLWNNILFVSNWPIVQSWDVSNVIRCNLFIYMSFSHLIAKSTWNDNTKMK